MNTFALPQDGLQDGKTTFLPSEHLGVQHVLQSAESIFLEHGLTR